MSKFLPISDIFCEFSFEIGKLRYDKSLKMLQMMKLGTQHVFQKEYGMIHVRKFPQNDPNNATSVNFRIFHF